MAARAVADEHGYVAVMTALLSVVLVGMAAFSVDVGNWYLTGQEEQRAADAAALAGIPNPPLDPTTAFSTARTFAAAEDHDFPHGRG
ncbi:MAG: hypothetical protein QOE89_1867 [Pseudonocardiales bacterium]|nr:hypothetical protein [Pseudonocardiales bacterium]